MQPRYRGRKLRARAGASPAFALALFLTSTPVIAGPLEDCYRAAESWLDVGPCLGAKSSEADAQLIEAERTRRRQLEELAKVTGRDAVLQAFEKTAKDFRAFRDSACSLARIEAEPGTGAGDFELDCRVRMTRSWIRELHGRSSRD